MLHTIAIKNYRSLLDVTLPLSDLNVITGPNASGKSNLYRAIRLLAETAQGGVVNALAKEGGLNSTYWAGHAYRPASVLVERDGPVVRAKVDGRWEVLTQHASSFESLFAYSQTPEAFALREEIRNWRFYDHFLLVAALMTPRPPPLMDSVPFKQAGRGLGGGAGVQFTRP